MRYDTRIQFVKLTEPIRLPNGAWTAGEAVRVERWANVSDVSNQRMTLVYGGFKQGVLTVRIQGRHEDAYDHIEINDKKYRVDNRRKFRHDQAFEVSELP